MTSLIERSDLRPLWERLADVSLNPARHSAPNARAHSESVARRARALARENGCSPSEQALLFELGLVHDLGKALGTTSPTASVELLLASGGVDPALIELVRYHDVNLAWWTVAQRGEPPTDRAWRKLARRVDARLLVLFMVADRVDCPGGWRENAPLVWFLEEARRRGLVPGDLVLDPGGDVASARLGIDIGRVIIGGGTGPGADTEFLGGDDVSALETPALPGAFEAIGDLVRLLEGRIWLVSKAGPRIERRTRLWLDARRFFEQTGLARDHVRFCRERRDKARHAEELGLTHFVDDRRDVLAHLEGIVPVLVLFGSERAPAFARAARSWREVPERLGFQPLLRGRGIP
jgi:hypothetical protein